MEGIYIIIIILFTLLSLYLLRKSSVSSLWLIAYLIILITWISSTTSSNISGLNILFTINIVLNFALIYATTNSVDSRTIFIVNMLLLTSSIGIFFQLSTSVKWLFLLYVFWVTVLLFGSFQSLKS